MLICKIFLRKFIYEVTSIISFDCCDRYSGIQQNSTCQAGSVQKCKMHVELQRLPVQQFLSHKSFAGSVIKKRNKQHFHHHTAFVYRRENKGCWYITCIRQVSHFPESVYKSRSPTDKCRSLRPVKLNLSSLGRQVFRTPAFNDRGSMFTSTLL